MNTKEQKVLILLMTIYNSEVPLKLGTVCKDVGLHPVFATVLNRNDFFMKTAGGKFIWNTSKPRPNIYMVQATIEEVGVYQGKCSKKHYERAKKATKAKLPVVDKSRIEKFSEPRKPWWKNLFRKK